MTMDNFSSFLESEEYFANPNNSYTPVKGQLGIKEECECNDLYLFPLPRY